MIVKGGLRECYSSKEWSYAKTVEFSQYLRMSIKGFEEEILALLRKLKRRKRKNVVGMVKKKSKF